jgi:uncharacterized protein
MMGKAKQEKENRTLATKVEVRAEGEGDQQQEVIEGYALKFDRWSDILGYWYPFREKIDSHALDEADMSNVVATFNHSQNMPLGRNTIGTGKGSLELTIDNIGLKFRCIPTETSYAQDLKENIRTGVINQCSFAFTIAETDDAEEWSYNETDEVYERTLKKIGKMYDVSVVTTPAYPDTEAVVGERSKEKLEKLELLRKRPEKNSIKLRKDKLYLLEKSV